ncbi:unnamed protein product [Moneuplotes crassus]|uniref:Uncharacterized protein n=1 Tax=Euplotes crassus TaxID=5936 RepID=A0AAD1UJY3_EUPCR|nr:unnamed protein product [Moneuplotes crassus]
MEKSTTLLTLEHELINKIRQIQKAIYHEEHKLHQEIATSLTISNPMGYSKKRHILFITSVPTSKTYPPTDPPIRPLCSMQQDRRVGLYFSKSKHFPPLLAQISSLISLLKIALLTTQSAKTCKLSLLKQRLLMQA